MLRSVISALFIRLRFSKAGEQVHEVAAAFLAKLASIPFSSHQRQRLASPKHYELSEESSSQAPACSRGTTCVHQAGGKKPGTWLEACRTYEDSYSD